MKPLRSMKPLTYEEALALALEAVPSPEPELIPIARSCGRVTAGTVAAPMDFPAFDNSSMDGYAVRAANVHHASPDAPVSLRLVGTVAAGQWLEKPLSPGTCARISTGAALPDGADAVVMQEDSRTHSTRENEVEFLDAPKPWENVRLKGELVKTGSSLSKAGEVITPGMAALLAAVGLDRVKVMRQPVLGIMATGSELIEPGTPLPKGKIYESNRLGLAQLAGSVCGQPKILPLVPDELAATEQALERAFEVCDAVITCGGVSVGPMDFVKSAFTRIGGELRLWRVAIKPGRPFVLGTMGKKVLFGLPGNPVSAMVTFLLLVRPALLKWQGAARLGLPVSLGQLAEPLSNPEERRHFLRVQVDEQGLVRSAGVQESHALNSLAAANGLIDLAPGTNLPAGALVRVLRWN